MVREVGVCTARHRGTRGSGRGRLAAGIALLALLSVACGAKQDFQFGEGAPTASQLDSVLYVPLNFDYTPGPELVDGVERLDREVRRQLGEAGVVLHEVRRSEVARQWREAQQALGGLSASSAGGVDADRYDLAREELARRLLADRPDAAVIMPQFVVTEGRYVGTRLRWDGVYKPPVVERKNRGVTAAMIKGKDMGVSVRISVFDRAGKRYFDRKAGIEPLMRYFFNEAFYVDEFDIKKEVRADLLEDSQALGEGVATALDPWIPKPGDVASGTP